jgi:DNA (cytosine-5)-methyltransferase 1
MIPRSVVRLTVAESREPGIGERRVDVVFGGAPCQGFSMIGQRAIDDPRNLLAKEFVRIVCQLDARTVAFENVKGITVGKHRQILDDLIAAFRERGYVVADPVQVLNARDYDAAVAGAAVPDGREVWRDGSRIPIAHHTTRG